MKKIISMILATTLAISSMICVSAADEGIKVYLEGNKINFDVQPQTINDRTMVPIRAIFEAMGANVTWDDATQTAISTKDNTTVKMKLNSTTEYINDVAHEMDVTPVIIDGRTLAPARYVAEAFGYKVDWDDTKKSVLISKNNNVANLPKNDESSIVVTSECKVALKQAKSYSDLLHMSKAALYDQLTSEYGGKFTAEEAQYAIDNLD